MVIPEYADGRSEDHPDLARDSTDTEVNPNELTRKAGGASQVTDDPQSKVTPKVVVDMREFRSDLPSILHKGGIDIEPATIEVGRIFLLLF